MKIQNSLLKLEQSTQDFVCIPLNSSRRINAQLDTALGSRGPPILLRRATSHNQLLYYDREVICKLEAGIKEYID